MDSGWSEQVRAAVLAQDDTALVALFEAAVRAEGRQGASRSWLTAVSAYDADAITG